MSTFYEILTDENPILRQKSEKVADFLEAIEIGKKMLRTMRAAGGVGLAAPQVGILKRIIVVDSGRVKGQIMINPVIHYRPPGMSTAVEGCLSMPGKGCTVTRNAVVGVKFQDGTGKEVVISPLTGLEARCVQHEIDHLDGKLMTDY